MLCWSLPVPHFDVKNMREESLTRHWVPAGASRTGWPGWLRYWDAEVTPTRHDSSSFLAIVCQFRKVSRACVDHHEQHPPSRAALSTGKINVIIRTEIQFWLESISVFKQFFCLPTVLFIIFFIVYEISFAFFPALLIQESDDSWPSRRGPSEGLRCRQESLTCSSFLSFVLDKTFLSLI